jgi:extracellular elastinolytic metalloproteinase
VPAAARAEAHDVALEYVRAHLPDVDFDTLAPPETTTADGVSTVTWRPTIDGIPAGDHELRVNVAGDRVLGVPDEPLAEAGVDTTPVLTAGEAVRAAQDAVGVHRPLPRTKGPAGATRATAYDDGTTAALALWGDRLAWRVTYRAAADAVWDVVVDADRGKVLRRVNLVKSDVPAKVWENYPGSPNGGTAVPVNLQPWLTGTDKLLGPNVHAYADTTDNGVGTEVKPDVYELVKYTGSGCSDLKPCSWQPANDWQTNLKQNAVQAFYLANRFHDHLAAAPIGFTGIGGDDPVRLETDDGAATGNRDNANMYTPPDGTSPIMQMYLWGPGAYRAMNGGDDASILFHEYTHGLSGRLIHDAGGAGALNLAQSGAMGEGWSDWYAKDFLVDRFPALDSAAVDGDVHMGTYTDATPNSIRSQGLDCPVGAPSAACPAGGYTYGDFGKIFTEPEVHYDGEIWAETLWDLRKAVGSSSEAERLITQGMRLSPPEPSFLDARNAILAADTAAGGAFQTKLWTVFAARGMGYYASTTGAEDTAPVEDFSPPPAPGEPRGTIAGRITDAEGAPLAGAKVALGSLLAVTDNDGRYALDAVPARAYANLLFSAPGHDRATGPVTVLAGQTTTLDKALRRDWAAQSGGATVSGGDEYAGDGCGSLATVDQHQGTAWSTDGPGPKTMTIVLPATIDVDHFEVDPGEGCGDGSGAAAKDMLIATSANGLTWTTAAAPSFTGFDRHRMNVVVPAAGASGVRYVRVTLLNTLGGSAYLDLSEFAVYTDPPLVTPAPTATPTATAKPSPAPTAVPAPTVVPPRPPATPAPSPVAKPAFTLAASGKRSIRVSAHCAAACPVTATLTVDAATARKLHTGRTLATVKRTLKAGWTAFTVKVPAKARFTKVTRIKATLTVRSGSVVERRRVTIRR